MKKSEILELILGAFAGLFMGLNIFLILTLNTASFKILSLSFDSLKQTKFYVVSSGSMEPAIKVGSAIMVIPKSTYVAGDVITFKANGGKNTLVTHRVKIKQPDISGEAYTTAGDANEDFDRWPVKKEDIVGKVAFSLPYLGYLVNFVKLPYGFILLIIIPATIIIYEELKSVKREMGKLLKSFLSKNEASDNLNLKKRVPAFKILSVLPVLGAGLIFVAVSSSFFLDSEKSINNILSAATTFPNPSPTPSDFHKSLVINEVLPDSSCSQGQTEAQWIEVYNNSLTVVNLKNFKISDGVNTIDLVTANNIEVSAGEFALLAHNNAIWNHCYSDNAVTTANLGGQLDINKGLLMLLDASGEVIDVVAWGEGTGLETKQDESVEREPDGEDTAFGIHFNPDDFVVRIIPDPGL